SAMRCQVYFFFFSSRRRHTRCLSDWSSDVCSSDLNVSRISILLVACNEQNGNPADINWRRVGEIESGFYPNTQRFHLSMGCNHCLEPSCLIGCPVDAYTKDLVTGIVQHSPETCIGCQYCTWNCSYGVPQYNPERGVVGKCDMCYGRLTDDREPACVSACPESAIRIEIVNGE